MDDETVVFPFELMLDADVFTIWRGFHSERAIIEAIPDFVRASIDAVFAWLGDGASCQIMAEVPDNRLFQRQLTDEIERCLADKVQGSAMSSDTFESPALNQFLTRRKA